MALYYVNVWDKAEKSRSRPVWKNSVIANDVNEAYIVGKAQFKLERPELSIEDYSIEASGYSVEKQGL